MLLQTHPRCASPFLSPNLPPVRQPPSPADQIEGDITKTRSAYRVLLAEDNDADIMVMEEILGQQNAAFDIVVANDGQQAIQLLRQLDENHQLPGFDIALIDLNLPKRTGHEVLATLRNTTRCRHIPAIIVTSSRAVSDITRARELGATEYFEKLPDLEAYSVLGALVMKTLQREPAAS